MIEGIEEIAAANGLTYLLGTYDTANIDADRAAYPLLVDLLTASGSLIYNDRIGGYTDSLIVNWGFCAPSPLDFKPDAVAEQVNRLKVLAVKVIDAVQARGQWTLRNSEINYSVLVNERDDNHTVLAVNATFESNVPVCADEWDG